MIAALFDLDGTIVKTPVWQRLTARMLRQRVNVGPVLAHTLYHYPQYPLTKVGLVDREGLRRAWAEHMPWVVRGMKIDETAALFRALAQEDLLPDVRPDVLERIESHRRKGHLVILLSGTLQPLLEAFAPLVGIEIALGTELEVLGGVYTGRLVPPSTYGPGKVDRIRSYFGRHHPPIDLSRSYAYADSNSDEALLSMVGNPVAVAPDAGLREIALRAGWSIMH